MTIKIYNAREVQQKKILNVLVYGPPGVGKTTFATTAPKPLILSLESGLQSIMNKNVDCVDIANPSEFMEGLGHAVKNDYKTVVIDSLTRYGEMKIHQLVAEDPDMERNSLPTIKHWGQLVTSVKKTIWALQSSEINVILIALEKETDDCGLIKRPALTGQLSQAVSGIVDVVGYLQADQKGVRRLSVNPTAKYYAKHRNPIETKILGDLEPDFQVLQSRIFQEVKP